jgi:methyl-accepting chemotaxis protein
MATRSRTGTAGLPRARTARHDDLPKGHDAVRDSVLDAPDDRHTAARADHPPVTPVLTALPVDVERKLAELVGIEPVVSEPVPTEPEPWVQSSVDEMRAAHFRRRVLVVAQQITLGGLLLLTGCAVLAARVDSKSLVVHSIPLMGWAIASAVCAVALAAMVTDENVAASVGGAKRHALGAFFMASLLVSITGIVANADGVAAPAWVLFFPLVVVTGAVLGPTLGLGVGALAAGGIYVAAAISHTLNVAGVGELVVILPACPLFGWAAGALASLAHDAVATARQQREGLIHDVARLSALLDSVAQGDLSKVPSLDNPADQATASLAVVFADTVLSLRRLVRQLAAVSDQLSSNSNELAHTATAHVGAVEQQSSAVAQTTSTIEELASTANAIATTALKVAKYAGSTRLDVDLGITSVSETTNAMNAIRQRVAELGSRTSRLDERVDQIGRMTRMIDDLARRTTMLAVNASIEAARVGEHGHGFATVADEIAALAAKARDAVAGISGIVTELEAEVEATGKVNREGLSAVEVGLERQWQVEEALARISRRVDDTTRAAHDITSATRQQRIASDAVVAAMHTVTGASQGATSATRSHAEAAARLRDLMDAVRGTVGQFRLE